MLEDFILSVVKIEGLGDIQNSECFLSMDSSLISSHKLDSLPVSYNIKASGLISLLIRDSITSTTIASLSFHSSLLHCNWFYWLPLFLSSDNYISALPEKISSPRLLLGVNKELFLPIVQEISEHSETYDEETTIYDTPGLNSNERGIQELKINHLQETLNNQKFVQEKNEKMIEDYKGIIQKLEETIETERKKHEKKCKELENLIEMYQEEIGYEKKYRIDMQEKFEHCLDCFDHIKKRENELIRLLEKKNQGLELSAGESIGIVPKKQFFEGFEKIPIKNKGKTSVVEEKVEEVLEKLRRVGFLSRWG